jgi:hypothetical protein
MGDYVVGGAGGHRVHHSSAVGLQPVPRGRTRAGTASAATVVNGTASGKSSRRERISTRRMMVASARVASSIAK